MGVQVPRTPGKGDRWPRKRWRGFPGTFWVPPDGFRATVAPDVSAPNSPVLMPAKSSGHRWWLLALPLAVAVLVAIYANFDVPALLRSLLQRIADLGFAGMVLFVVLYVLGCVLFIPGSILTIGAGAVFGLGWGVVLVSTGATIGATAAFLIARYLARDWVEQRLQRHPRFRVIDQAVAREGWKIIGLLRLSPVFPFNLLNYALGLTSVSLRDYFLASWIGMLPGVLLYVYLGSLVRDLATLGAEPRERSPWEWALYVVGLAATAVATVYITRLARRALAGRLDEDASGA